MGRRDRRTGETHGGRARLVVTLGLAMSVGLTACAPPRGPAPSPAGRPAPVSIDVDNQAFADADIYSLIGGMRTRLGTVTGSGQGRFAIPWTPRNVGMEIRVIGGGRYDTQTLPVHPGGRLKLIVMPGLSAPSLLLLPE